MFRSCSTHLVAQSVRPLGLTCGCCQLLALLRHCVPICCESAGVLAGVVVALPVCPLGLESASVLAGVVVALWWPCQRALWDLRVLAYWQMLWWPCQRALWDSPWAHSISQCMMECLTQGITGWWIVGLNRIPAGTTSSQM